MPTFINQKMMFAALDDFIYKSKGVKGELRDKLIKSINEFISENELDSDQHNFIDITKIPE